MKSVIFLIILFKKISAFLISSSQCNSLRYQHKHAFSHIQIGIKSDIPSQSLL